MHGKGGGGRQLLRRELIMLNTRIALALIMALVGHFHEVNRRSLDGISMFRAKYAYSILN